METKIIDNVLNNEGFLNYYNTHILLNCNHYTHTSNANDNTFFYAATLDNDFPTKYLTHLLNKQYNFTQSFNIKRVYFNLQWPSQDGTWHLDDGDCTMLYFISNPEKGGEFCIQDPNERKIEYKKDRLILFEGSKYRHKGLSFSKNSRISIAYKLDKN